MGTGNYVNMTLDERTSATFLAGPYPAVSLATANSIEFELIVNESSMTTEFYTGPGSKYIADGWAAVTGGFETPIIWWPDDAPWFRVMLTVLYGSVFAGCVIGK
jgi:hypothetical protein